MAPHAGRDGAVCCLFQGALKSTSRDCPLPQTSPRAPRGRATRRMEALGTSPTRSRMTPLRSWASSLKRPPLPGARSSPCLTWPRPSATGFSLKMTLPGPAGHRLLKKQVGQVGGWGGFWLRSVLIGVLSRRGVEGQGPEALATSERAGGSLVCLNSANGFC